MSFSNGLQIGPYRVLEQLGQGGMATVYKAYHASLDRYVAIKVLHQAFMEDPNFLARFQREARLVARLEHPNIVPIYDYAEHEGQPYLVMKYIEGETLKARLQRSPLNASEVQSVVETVGAALAYAHKQGILHRDIKPSNVILSKDGSLYLADFGLARIAQSGESTLTTDMVLGTPQYISPEQAMAKKDLDAGTDIYSLGVMLYEMTVGRVPFSADTPFSVIHDHIYAPLPLPSAVNPKISPDLERVLLKALAKDRADRYIDVPAMVEAFKQAWTNSASTVAVGLPAASDSTTLPPAVSQPSAPLTMPVAPEARFQPAAAPVSETGSQPRKKKSRARWLWLAGLALLCLCCPAVIFAWSRGGAPNGPPDLPTVFVPDLPPAQVASTQEAIPPTLAPPPFQPPKPTLAGEELNLGGILLPAAQKEVKDNPDNPRANLKLGVALIDDGQELDGYQAIHKAAELGKKNPLFLVGAARSLDGLGLPLGSLLMYLQLAENEENKPGNPNREALFDEIHMAVYEAYREEIAPQVVDFPRLRRSDPGLALSAEAHYAILFQSGQPQTGQKLIDQLRQKQPDWQEVNLLQAELFIEQGQKDQALAILEKLSATPNLPEWIQTQTVTLLGQLP